jgi:SOS-response transcriptional repressor LexA
MLVLSSNLQMDIDAYRRKRLRELVLTQAKGNVAEFARLHNQDAARLRQVLNPNYRGGKGFKEGVARRLESELGLTPLYFDLGIQEEMVPQHAEGDSKAPISAQNKIIFTGTGTENGGSIGKDASPRFDQNVAMAQNGQREIPVISYAQAKKMREGVDPFAIEGGAETITTDLDLSSSAFGMVIKGESMLPEFREGDKVIIDPSMAPQPGDFVVAENGEEEATFKKYRPRGTGDRGEMVFELVPLNDDFPTLHSERDHLRVIGVMVEHRKYRRR